MIMMCCLYIFWFAAFFYIQIRKQIFDVYLPFSLLILIFVLHSQVAPCFLT